MTYRPSFSMRPPERHDALMLLEGRNSPRVHPFLFTDCVAPTEEIIRNAEKRIMSRELPIFVFSGHEKPLGLVNLTHLDKQDGRGDWTFYIWAADAPKGSATMMLAAFLDELFLRRSLRKLSARIFSFNDKSIHLHRKLGFREEGVQKEHIVKGGIARDIMLFAMFERDWRDRRREFIPLIEQVEMEKEHSI